MTILAIVISIVLTGTLTAFFAMGAFTLWEWPTKPLAILSGGAAVAGVLVVALQILTLASL